MTTETHSKPFVKLKCKYEGKNCSCSKTSGGRATYWHRVKTDIESNIFSVFILTFELTVTFLPSFTKLVQAMKCLLLVPVSDVSY